MAGPHFTKPPMSISRAHVFGLLSLAWIMTGQGCSSSSVTVSLSTADSPPMHFPLAVTYDDAMRNMDFENAGVLAGSHERKALAHAAVHVITGHLDSASAVLRPLCSRAGDSAVRELAGELSAEISFYESRWHEVLEMESTDPDTQARVLAREFAVLPGRQMVFQADSSTFPIELSSSGTPIITVNVNGHPEEFWFDTGAEVSVVASDVAKACQVRSLGSTAANAGTATSHRVKVLPAVIEELRFGNVLIKNHPAMVIDRQDLELKLFGFIRIMRIRGLIGWDVIRHLDVEIDYKNKMMTIRRPLRRKSVQKNLFWFDGPMVKVRTPDGLILHFLYDTGARVTSISDSILGKLMVENARQSKQRIGGAGGWENITSREIPNFDLLIGEYLLNFSTLKTHPIRKQVFAQPDGRLGGDIARHGRVRIDAFNNEFDLEFGDTMVGHSK